MGRFSSINIKVIILKIFQVPRRLLGVRNWPVNARCFCLLEKTSNPKALNPNSNTYFRALFSEPILRSSLTVFSVVLLQVYKGYVDDPRNTDNSWMETIAMNYHDDTGDVFSAFKLQVQSSSNRFRFLLLTLRCVRIITPKRALEV